MTMQYVHIIEYSLYLRRHSSNTRVSLTKQLTERFWLLKMNWRKRTLIPFRSYQSRATFSKSYKYSLFFHLLCT